MGMEANIYITRGLFVKAQPTKVSLRKVNGFPEKYMYFYIGERERQRVRKTFVEAVTTLALTLEMFCCIDALLS